MNQPKNENINKCFKVVMKERFNNTTETFYTINKKQEYVHAQILNLIRAIHSNFDEMISIKEVDMKCFFQKGNKRVHYGFTNIVIKN